MRVIARLDIKNEFVIKGIHLEGLRKVGNPNELASNYYDHGIDEIVFMDAVASLYDRNNLFHIIEAACRDVFVPIAVGGGLRTVKDVSSALSAGADKVVINTGAVQNIKLIEEAARCFGSQCLVGSIEAKQREGGWKAYIDNGREPTDHDVVDWAYTLQEAGVGEIMLTSVDQEGTSRGFDVDVIEQVNNRISRPLIVSGGYGKPVHLENLLARVQPSAVAFASVLHYQRSSISDLKGVAHRNGSEVPMS
ncbi:MAG: imidazole glycerol phosphate synthase subunit HisF [Granulosicoccus sp.]